jgi:hypothetical protein
MRKPSIVAVAVGSVGEGSSVYNYELRLQLILFHLAI